MSNLPNIEEFALTLADGSLTESKVTKWLHIVVKNTKPCSDIKKQYLALVSMNPNISLVVYRYCLNMAPACIDLVRVNVTDDNHCYRQRFDVEHMFRFKKQRLLMTNYQTPEVEHEASLDTQASCLPTYNYGLQRTYLIIYRDARETSPRAKQC